MNQIIIRKIDNAHASDARLPNQPFQLWGRVIPALQDGKWSYRVRKNDQVDEDCFPNEEYDVAHDDRIFLGAYSSEQCVGVAVLHKEWYRYLYLNDLKVNAGLRGHGIGGMLIEAAMEEAKVLGFRGVYTIGQDTNASACLFYLKHGFTIGGFDNHVYDGTKLEGTGDIIFYRELESL